MKRKLKRYIEYKARSLETKFPQLQKEDLINDAWTIYLCTKCDCGGADNPNMDKTIVAFVQIRRYFNRIKMATIREAKRLVSLDSLKGNRELMLDSPEDAIIAKIDLMEESRELCNPTSEWNRRKARVSSRRYLNGI